MTILYILYTIMSEKVHIIRGSLTYKYFSLLFFNKYYPMCSPSTNFPVPNSTSMSTSQHLPTEFVPAAEPTNSYGRAKLRTSSVSLSETSVFDHVIEHLEKNQATAFNGQEAPKTELLLQLCSQYQQNLRLQCKLAEILEGIKQLYEGNMASDLKPAFVVYQSLYY